MASGFVTPRTPRSGLATPNPDDLQAFDHAAAGHAGVLSDSNGSVVVKPCTAAEVAFYEETIANHPAFVDHMPTYLGTLQLNAPAPQPTSSGNTLVVPPTTLPTHNRNTNIVLSNIAYGFKEPCVLDVKLGAQLWDNDAPLDKRERLDKVADSTTSRPLGLRVAGMKVYKGLGEEVKKKDPAVQEDGNRVYDKYYGRTFTKDNVIEAFKEYFSAPITEEQKKIIAGRFLQRVTAAKKVIEAQESRMYSASMLFAYEGNPEALNLSLQKEAEREKEQKEKAAAGKAEEDDGDDEDEDDDEEELHRVEDMKIIDFAHATWTPGQGPDENMLQGVRSLEKLWAQLA